jgi:uncharacterized protein YcfJ
MKKYGKFAVVAAPALAMTLLAAAPADAQSRYRDYDRKDNTAQNAILGAVLGGVAGAVLGNGDGSYVAGGALAGAALGAVASSDNNRSSYSYGRADCNYFRAGRCYRNQGHWERENGINSRDYRYDRRDRDYRYDRRW